MVKVVVLTAITGSQVGKRYSLGGRNSVIGSANGCDMVLYDRAIEPRHAEIRHMLDSWFIVPLTSNGTGVSVNGAIARSQSRFRAGDKLTIGSVTYTVAIEELAERQVGA